LKDSQWWGINRRVDEALVFPGEGRKKPRPESRTTNANPPSELVDKQPRKGYQTNADTGQVGGIREGASPLGQTPKNRAPHPRGEGTLRETII